MKMMRTGAVLATCLAFTTVQAEEQALLASGKQKIVKPVNIAIIGAGAGGASTAYHLSKFAATAGIPVNLTIFERNPYIGGRSTTVNAYDDPSKPVELGASIFVSANRILVGAVEEFNLSTFAFQSDQPEINGAELAVWDGKSFVFTQDRDSSSWWSNAKLLWKYGLAPIKTVRLMKSTVANFLSLYDEPIFPWADLTQAVQDVGLQDVTAVTGEQYMEANGITGAFGHDIVQASTRVNYAQNLKHIHGLEAMVCMATDGAMSIEGGNWRIFEQMVKASGATAILETEVTTFTRQDNGTYMLDFRHAGVSGSESSQLFDAVVLASPWQYSNINFVTEPQHVPDKIPYVELHVTLFTSPHLLSLTFFNMPPDRPAPKMVLTTLPEGEQPCEGSASCGSPGFFSISMLRPIQNSHNNRQEYLYKIFSPAPPNTTFLTHLLGLKQPHDEAISEKDISWMCRKIWNSYPYELPRVTFDAVRLDDDLWYTSSIESFISTMETSALSGMNVARLVVDQWQKKIADLTL